MAIDPKVLYPAIGIGSIVIIGIAFLFSKRDASSYQAPSARYEFTTERLAEADSAPRGSHVPQYPRDSGSAAYASARGSESSMTGGKKSRRKKRQSKKYSKRV
jgi:hypothetical protein